MKLKNAIFTSSDANHGDFLANHWLKSLKNNVNLDNIDVVIIDYGLTKKQAETLKENNCIVFKCVKDGFPNSIKFRDINSFLSSKKYGQVMTCDGGDIIFQADISPLFEKNKNMYRAVCEDMSFPFEMFFAEGYFKKGYANKIKKALNGKKMINAGILIAPYALFKRLCEECNAIIHNKTFGPDQVAINYILYRDGFKALHSKYNFIITTTAHPFFIRESEFFLANGEKIPIVHNAGRKSFFRPIKNFGYGKGRNKINKAMLMAFKSFYKVLSMMSNKK